MNITKESLRELESWYQDCTAYYMQIPEWEKTVVILREHAQEAKVALIRMKVYYVSWMRQQQIEPESGEYVIEYRNLMQVVDAAKEPQDQMWWETWMRYFIVLSGSQWRELWDAVDRVMIQGMKQIGAGDPCTSNDG